MLLFKRGTITKALFAVAGMTLLLATNVFPAGAAVGHEALLRDRLTEVRELLERRQAYRHMLDEQIETLSLDLDQLHLQRKAALAVLSAQVDKARGYELELDRLMPRILPRLSRLDALRKQGAIAIADLARINRNNHVENKTKARFSAAKTISIDQMRRASTSVRLLRRQPNKLIGKHRDLDFQIPLLARKVDDLSVQQETVQRRRDGAVRQAADLSVDIGRLTAEEHRLARNMLARTLTVTTGSRASIDRRPVGKSDIGNADIKSATVRRTHDGATTMPLDDIHGQANGSAEPMIPVMPGQTASSKALVAGWTNQGRVNGIASRLAIDRGQDVAVLRAPPLDSLSSRVSRGQIEESQPLVPTGETIGYTLADVIRQTDLPAIEIPAAPRQRVAAPDNGRVVFAGDFRSYGLLLIIEHDSEYHTLLWGFSSLDIKLGDRVLAGQIVGVAGAGISPKLHVELRRNGEPVSPEVWLAASNSGVKG